MPAPPMPMKCSAPASSAGHPKALAVHRADLSTVCARSARAPPAAASTMLVRDPLGGVGSRGGPGRRRHLRHPLRRAEQRADLARQARAVELVVGHHHRRARPLHVARVERLVVGGGVRIGHEDRGQAGRGHLEHRAAGARGHEVGGGERVGERLDVGNRR